MIVDRGGCQFLCLKMFLPCDNIALHAGADCSLTISFFEENLKMMKM